MQRPLDVKPVSSMPVYRRLWFWMLLIIVAAAGIWYWQRGAAHAQPSGSASGKRPGKGDAEGKNAPSGKSGKGARGGGNLAVPVAASNLTLPTGDIHGTPPAIPASIPSRLLERRPDIASAERRVAAANAEIGLAKVAFYPSLTLTGSAGFLGSSLANWFTWPSRFWSVGPALSQTLFDFGRRRAQLEQSEAFYDSLVAGYRQTALTAFQQVEDNLAALRILEKEASQQQVAVTSAEQSLELELDRYKAGTVSYLDVTTSQTIALTNERAAVTILRDRMTAAVALIRALGGGWDASALPSAGDLRTSATATPQPLLNRRSGD